MKKDLINQLCQDLNPVLPAQKPLVTSLIWILLSGLLLGGFVSLFHRYRDDLFLVTHSLRFLWIFTTLILFSGFTAAQAFRSGIPGQENGRNATLFMLLLAASFVIPVLYLLAEEPARLSMTGFDPRTGWHCSFSIVLYSLIPAFGLLWFLKKKLAATRPEFTGRMLGLAVGSLGAAILAWCCPINEGMHILIWHLFPIFILSLIFVRVAKKVLHF